MCRAFLLAETGGQPSLAGLPIIQSQGYWISMLFSGSVKSYKCSNCDRNFSVVTPTSVIPMLIVVFVAAAIWAGNISEFFDLSSRGLLIAFPIGVALAIGSFLLTFVLLQRAFSGWEESGKCPGCGGALKGVGGGFLDGATPSRQEVLLYAIVVVVPLGLALLIR